MSQNFNRFGAPMMKYRKRSFAVVFDLEFTAWEGSMQTRWSRPGEHAEVVQIGAAKIDGERLKIIDTFETLVKPRVNPVLSDYLIALTGITNEAVGASGLDFITAYRAFLDFVGDARLWAFGRDDLVLAANLKLYGWDGGLPVPPYSNVLPWFAEQGVDLNGRHACDVAEAVGLEFQGRKHDALADANSVASGLIAVIGRGAPNPFVDG
jgi:inhibitor of KinA sporulation pathway (predicted exonuclease)